ncbi:hypothetical protein VZT92_017825 [Zoarces viviparus]|uniref:Uncharacterized protein n=1 Tax=Zoarces viviparus TaxID=48416 RepID=A0AAW1EMX1_ZOAVI
MAPHALAIPPEPTRRPVPCCHSGPRHCEAEFVSGIRLDARNRRLLCLFPLFPLGELGSSPESSSSPRVPKPAPVTDRTWRRGEDQPARVADSGNETALSETDCV